MKISIYGLGQFGYALLRHIENNISEDDVLYGYDYRQSVVDHFKKTGEHPFLYPGHKIQKTTNISNFPQKIITGTDLLILAVPSSSTLDIIPQIQKNAKNGIILLNTAKALDYETGKRLSVLYKENLTKLNYEYGLFAGGTIAKDVFSSQILGAVIASENKETAKKLQQILQSHNLRLSTSTDLIGVEYASAFKNVISIVTGYVHGKGLGYGSETFILSKIAIEVESLILEELGGLKETFSISSQAWGNDMFMSATGKTRNREFGILLGKGYSVNEAITQMEKENKTVEGIKTLQAINKLTEIRKYPLLYFLYSNIILNLDTNFFDLIKNI